ncbi:hypothetical protein HNY73_015385 [Argiope bruennichi]|uniref:IRF tryptophan pentad repeat domain-containing protein n=1 Tax=Argiope bruennichi TaxID=94029 RepID=A0A8T0EWL9_ARGBR|nr:hypothetical protein HNY73_015385 [Argiope bruennichi]
MPTLLENFMIPSLKEKSFGHLLSWVDEENGILKIFWQHKNSSQWKEEDFTVFKAWDAMKGRMPTETNIKYLTQAKQRFRAAMLKHKSIKLLKSPEKNSAPASVSLQEEEEQHIPEVERNEEPQISRLEAARILLNLSNHLAFPSSSPASLAPP